MANFPTLQLDLSELKGKQIDVFLNTFPLVLTRLAGPEAVRHLKRESPRRTGRMRDSAFFLGVPGFGVELGYSIFYASFQPTKGKATRDFAKSARFTALVSQAFNLAYIAARRT